MVSTLKILVTYFTNISKCKTDTGISTSRSANIFVPDISQSDNIMTKDNKKNPPVTQPNIRSNIVKEVEKLEKNREERRQRQAEQKAEKVVSFQMASGNPYWDFLNMIR